MGTFIQSDRMTNIKELTFLGSSGSKDTSSLITKLKKYEMFNLQINLQSVSLYLLLQNGIKVMKCNGEQHWQGDI